MSLCSSNMTYDLTPKEVIKSKNSLSQKNITLIKALSNTLSDEIEFNEIYDHSPKKDLFYSEKNKSRSIEYFISELIDELKIERSTLILSYISMKKLLSKSKNYLSIENFEKLFLTSCYINSKFNEDKLYETEIYAKICKLSIDELIL